MYTSALLCPRARFVFAFMAVAWNGELVAQLPPQPAPNAQNRPLQRIFNSRSLSEDSIVSEAATVLRELSGGTVTQIPENLLSSAEGVAIVPRYVRGAFVIGVAGGRGVLMVRDASRNWQAPEFITIGGGSVGWQAGVQSTDLVLVFRSVRSLTNIRTGTITLGVNASVAAGPLGRFASAATDSQAQAEIFTYSRTRGLFAGIALDGASLQIDVPATQAFYQTNAGGPAVMPPSAISLVQELTHLSRTVVPAVATTASNMVAIPVERLRQLENDVASLLSKVDEQWRAFLALPSGWQGASEISVQEINSTLARYERVASDSQFASLNATPEFERTITALRSLAPQTPSATTLALPPPPSVERR